VANEDLQFLEKLAPTLAQCAMQYLLPHAARTAEGNGAIPFATNARFIEEIADCVRKILSPRLHQKKRRPFIAMIVGGVTHGSTFLRQLI